LEQKIVKKRRSDRNHLIYQLTNLITKETYVGITVCSGRAVKVALEERWKRHVHRALNENRNWKLCEAIRTHGHQNFTRSAIKVVRGKALAHREERVLISELSASLNTF
jgi:protein involved in ribonucleotide reduction